MIILTSIRSYKKDKSPNNVHFLPTCNVQNWRMNPEEGKKEDCKSILLPSPLYDPYKLPPPTN